VNGGWPVGLERKKREEKRKEGKGKKNGQYSHFTFFIYFIRQGEAIFVERFLTRGARARKVGPLKESEPKLFLEESEPCQTGPHTLISQ
jgi:hypothetical protein